MRFADDLLLAATSLADLSEMIQNLSHEASAFGLSIHPQKTKILGNVPDNKRKLGENFVRAGNLDSEIMSFGGHVKYLG